MYSPVIALTAPKPTLVFISSRHVKCSLLSTDTDPDSKVHGANMGTIWGWQTPGGPHIGPINFFIWGVSNMMKTMVNITGKSIGNNTILFEVPYEMKCILSYIVHNRLSAKQNQNTHIVHIFISISSNEDAI